MRGKDPSFRVAAEKYSKKHFLYPLCWTQSEMPLHFVQCTKLIPLPDAIDLRKALLKKLCNLSTYDTLIELIISLLKGLPPEQINFNISSTFTIPWNRAIDCQQHLGWSSFIQGFWHSSWKDVQDKHMVALKTPLSNQVLLLYLRC